jgi:CRP-like cAMP-binding protein
MSAPDFIANNSALLTRYFVGNLEYVLLITSMLMTRMLLLRVLAISSGFVGACYSMFWLSDPVGTFWEMAFTLVNVAQIALITYRNGSSRFNDEERAFYKQIVPTLEPHQTRRLMQIGTWRDGGPGTELTRQGETVSHLIFLRSGVASVLVDGRRVGNCSEGDLIGEISIRTGKPATATVVASESIRYFALERDALHRLMKADPEIALAIDVNNRLDLESKLVRMNQAALQLVPEPAERTTINQELRRRLHQENGPSRLAQPVAQPHSEELIGAK